MKHLLLVLSLASLAAMASEQTTCTANKGTYMTGKVTTAPKFAPGSFIKGVETSHTHVTLKSDSNGKSYDIAIDNVFASGYDQAGESVPQPLKGLTVGTHLEVCGLPFTGGMHWVHTNCGATPTTSQPNGWVKVLDSKNNPGQNLENNQEYCYLWN
jgi:hypothetical protein